MSIREEEDPELSLDDSSDNIIPSDRLAAQSSAQLEDELAKFRYEWKMELLNEQKDATTTTTSGGGKSTSNSASNKQKSQRKSNRMEHHALPSRASKSQNIPQVLDDDTTTAKNSLEPELNYEQPKTNEQKAKYLFDKAVQLEQQGRHYEAIKFYRMAMQLDADIEFKLASNKPAAGARTRMKNKKGEFMTHETSDDDEEKERNEEEQEESAGVQEEEVNIDNELKTLYERFTAMTMAESKLCERNFPQKATHIGQLPVEVMIIILKWVVSEHLDMRSLDNFAAVCKGFYVLGRDPRIWRLACAKIWGENNINNYLSTYSSWRDMYLQRPRLNFDGVYISKSSYARAGEQGLDNFYQPWHLVEYYRYLRFFADGSVLFLTSPDEPKVIVSKLKTRTLNNSSSSSSSSSGQQQHANYISSAYQPFIANEHTVLRGTWTLALKKVSIVLIKRIIKSSLTSGKYARRQAPASGSNREPVLEQEHVFRLELELNGKMNNQLHWIDYNIDVINKVSNTINNTRFDLNRIDFPNFFFSRVKSYSTSTDMPLK